MFLFVWEDGSLNQSEVPDNLGDDSAFVIRFHEGKFQVQWEGEWLDVENSPYHE